MNTFNRLCSLLVAIIYLGLISSTVAQSVPKEKEVSVDVLRNGCIPGNHAMCPGEMRCWIDARFKRFGQCVCNPGSSMKIKPPTPTAPGSEIANLPNDYDCVITSAWNIYMGLFYLFLTGTTLSIHFGSLAMVKALIVNQGMKFNSSVVATFALVINGLGQAGRVLINGLISFGWDKEGIGKRYFYRYFEYITLPTTNFLMLESTCTWFDLWQKSSSMSKRSSSLITVLRTIFRTYTFGYLLFFILYNNQNSFGLRFPTTTLGIVNDINQWMLASCQVIAAPLLARILCKDMKDVTNPNWKAASAIRITAGNALTCTLLFNLCIRFFTGYTLWNTDAQHMQEAAFLGLFQFTAVNVWGYYQYLQFAHRRYLKDTPGSRISQYFGFSTIGLKGSSVRESSITSLKSSVSAKTMSVVSTSSTTGEGTMA